jgi:hypothetical protein
VNISTGGVSARRIIASLDIVHTGVVTSGAPSGATGQGKLYYDATTARWMVLQGTAAAVPMISTSGPPGGPVNAVQFNTGPGTFAGSSNFTFNSSTNLLTVQTASSGNPGIDVINGYLQADGGLFVSASTAYNSIQTQGGATLLTRLNVYPNFTPDLGSGQDPYLKVHCVGQNGAIAIYVDAYDTSGGSFPFALPGVIGRRALGPFNGPYQNLPSGTPLFAMGGRGSTTSGFTTANASVISFQTSEAWSPSANGAEIVFATTKNLGTSRSNWMFLRNNGLLEVVGTSGAAGILLDNGYMQANDAGFFANGSFVSVFNAPNGGASLGQAVYLAARGAPSSPLTNYGGIGYNGGSTYWYWNGSSWATINFASIGGGGAVSGVFAGTGVSVNQNTGNVTVSIGQAVGTGNAVTFASVSATNTLSSTNGLIINGLQVANSSGIWSNSVQTTGHVFGGDFGIQGVFVGGTADITISGVGTLHFQGGIFKNMT